MVLNAHTTRANWSGVAERLCCTLFQCILNLFLILILIGLILSLDNNLRLHIHIKTSHKCHRPLFRPPGLYGGNCFCKVHKTHHAG